MNLYLLWQNENTGYDTYDSVVVAANSEDEARLIVPCGSSSEEYWEKIKFDKFPDWACNPYRVNVELIGAAVEGTSSGVILASFNAG